MNTFNIVTTIIYIVLSLIALYLYYRRDKASFSRINISNITFSKIYTIALPLAIVIIGAVLRFYKISHVPDNFQVSGVFSGFEQYIFSAITGVLSLAAFFITVRTLCALSLDSTENTTKVQYVNAEFLWMPLISLTILAFCPWHIILSKWSLFSIGTSFWIILALMLFSLGSKKQHESTSFSQIGSLFARADRNKKRSLSSSNGTSNLLFALSAICYAMCVYSSHLAFIIVPIHLLLICILFVKKGNMTVSQMLLEFVVFILFLLPLIAFYVINLFGLPEIITPIFSIRHQALRGFTVFSQKGFVYEILNNIIAIAKNLSLGEVGGQPLNEVTGFAPLYSFTFPVTLLGIIVSFVRCKNGEDVDLSFVSLFVPSLILVIIGQKDITGMAILFVPAVYFLARGLVFLVNEFVYVEKQTTKKAEELCFIIIKAIAPALFFAATILFVKDFYTFL